MPPDLQKPYANVGDVAVLGSGRWARQIAGTLASLLSDSDRKVLLCTDHYLSNWEEWLDAQPEDGQRFHICTSIQAALKEESVTHVFIARKAKNHSQDSIAALELGKAVFVEKPFALSHEEAVRVSEGAETIPCVTGTTLMYAPNLCDFKDSISGLGEIAEIMVHWSDAIGEKRYGEHKSYDAGLNVVEDVFLHIWSLLILIKPGHDFKLSQTHVHSGGRIVELVLCSGQAKVNAHLERDAEDRKRHIFVKGSNGEAVCDFTKEPGSASVNGVGVDISKNFSSPLQIHIERFLTEPLDHCSNLPSAVRNFLSAQKIVDEVTNIVRAKQRALLSEGTKPVSEISNRDLEYARRELELSGNHSPATDL